MYFQLISALTELHKCDIFHRDIKPENCLIDDNFNLFLCDFGIARDKNNTVEQTAQVGTLGYMSPEISGLTKFVFNY